MSSLWGEEHERERELAVVYASLWQRHVLFRRFERLVAEIEGAEAVVEWSYHPRDDVLDSTPFSVIGGAVEDHTRADTASIDHATQADAQVSLTGPRGSNRTTPSKDKEPASPHGESEQRLSSEGALGSTSPSAEDANSHSVLKSETQAAEKAQSPQQASCVNEVRAEASEWEGIESLSNTQAQEVPSVGIDPEKEFRQRHQWMQTPLFGSETSVFVPEVDRLPSPVMNAEEDRLPPVLAGTNGGKLLPFEEDAVSDSSCSEGLEVFQLTSPPRSTPTSPRSVQLPRTLVQNTSPLLHARHVQGYQNTNILHAEPMPFQRRHLADLSFSSLEDVDDADAQPVRQYHAGQLIDEGRSVSRDKEPGAGLHDEQPFSTNQPVESPRVEEASLPTTRDTFPHQPDPDTTLNATTDTFDCVSDFATDEDISDLDGNDDDHEVTDAREGENMQLHLESSDRTSQLAACKPDVATTATSPLPQLAEDGANLASVDGTWEEHNVTGSSKRTKTAGSATMRAGHTDHSPIPATSTLQVGGTALKDINDNNDHDDDDDDDDDDDESARQENCVVLSQPAPRSVSPDGPTFTSSLSSKQPSASSTTTSETICTQFSLSDLFKARDRLAAELAWTREALMRRQQMFLRVYNSKRPGQAQHKLLPSKHHITSPNAPSAPILRDRAEQKRHRPEGENLLCVRSGLETPMDK